MLTALPPTLVVRTDEEKAQSKAFHFLAQRAQLRMAIFRDPLHRDWNDVKNAIKRSGLWGAPSWHKLSVGGRFRGNGGLSRPPPRARPAREIAF